ncbi:ribonuclease R [Pasteuria penetrans]|uniref:ribonuclease R n=1 Tax=Pasteuria penetrans TaxID=86005 RepID=UPI000F9A01E1|nr:ribonuclease R [Pasteuria penetrans]
MITEQDLQEFMSQPNYRSLTKKGLMKKLGISPTAEGEFGDLLRTMSDRGMLVETRGRRYGLPEHFQFVRGVLQGNSRGFGFVVPGDMPGEDIHIRRNDLNGAMDRDVVWVRIHRRVNRYGSGDRPEGRVVRVLRRGRSRLVGTFIDLREHLRVKAYSPEPCWAVVPDEKKILLDFVMIPDHWRGAVTPGSKVVVALHPDDENQGVLGEIIQILGHSSDPGVDILTIICKYDLPLEFPEEVLQEARGVSSSPPVEDDPVERRDLRQRRMVTIDGEDAKDLDDAVSIESLGDHRVRLGVHIADVSHYVRAGTALDKEAARRGCSVYLVDRVLPMLPPELSNGVCSLYPRQDRLTITCDMEIDVRSGKQISYEIYPSLISTQDRMTYTQVRCLLSEGEEVGYQALAARYATLLDDFQQMKRLALLLRGLRLQRGAIDFDVPESIVRLDEQGKPVGVFRRPSSIAEQLIEEFMLAANETVAGHLRRARIPSLHRVHEQPDGEKLQAFYEFIARMGYHVRGRSEQVQPRNLQRLLMKVKGTPGEYVISTMLLRSMKQAKYAPECLGHFGLAAECYTHFTSPIRRYPDLIIHRILRQTWGSLRRWSAEEIEVENENLGEIAQNSSLRERIAIDAEREVLDCKKTEFMADKIGEEYEGIISGVTSFGIFVSLPSTIEGLVHISSLWDDYYVFHVQNQILVGETTTRTFRIGDFVRVIVHAVNCNEQQIDFRLLTHKGGEFPRQPDRVRRGKAYAGVHSQSGFPRTGRTARGKDKSASAVVHRSRKKTRVKSDTRFRRGGVKTNRSRNG